MVLRLNPEMSVTSFSLKNLSMEALKRAKCHDRTSRLLGLSDETRRLVAIPAPPNHQSVFYLPLEGPSRRTNREDFLYLQRYGKCHSTEGDEMTDVSLRSIKRYICQAREARPRSSYGIVTMNGMVKKYS